MSNVNVQTQQVQTQTRQDQTLVQVPTNVVDVSPEKFYKEEYMTYRELQEITARIKERMEEMGFKAKMWGVEFGKNGELVGYVHVKNYVIEVKELYGDELYYKTDGYDRELEDVVTLLMICGKLLVRELKKGVKRVLVKDREMSWKYHEGLLIYSKRAFDNLEVGKYVLTVSYTMI